MVSMTVSQRRDHTDGIPITQTAVEENSADQPILKIYESSVFVLYVKVSL